MVLAAVTQMTSSPAITQNAKVAVNLIQRAAKAGAKAVFLPEATDFISPPDRVASLTYSQENKEFVDAMTKAASESKVWVSVGVHEPADEAQKSKDAQAGSNTQRCWNTQLIINDAGLIKQRYRKTHLFDVDTGDLKAKESDTTIPGLTLEPPIQTPLGKVGALICYDMRFAEPALRMRRQGADILTYPSAFAVRTGAAHWSILLQARAIETQSWVIAAAQVGQHPDTSRQSWGHALVVDPWGTIVAQCPDTKPHKPTFALADIVSLRVWMQPVDHFADKTI